LNSGRVMAAPGQAGLPVGLRRLLELKMRLGLLVRFLNSKGTNISQEYAALITEVRPQS
jgi:hypothetical protein